jgi:hypothetical protein
MTTTIYKLVPVQPNEISDDEPKVVLCKNGTQAATISTLNSFRPDFVLNLMGGSAAVLNLKNLINQDTVG